ncbi:DNA polymerase Y family protein [Streptomyces sp. P1-3]|uniref:DNA polymerase Y family protein n=1 Tax=Streptomyces sp. P1-3 TaxID=3421658 RepID=UPI003D35D007
MAGVPVGPAGGSRRDVPGVLYVRFHSADGAEPGADTYEGLLALLAELTPVVEALPPDAALADVRGALRYFGRDAAGLAEIVRVRALARYGVDCTVGVATNPLLARMAAAAHLAEGGVPGAVRSVPGTPEAVAAFLAHKPAAALPGVGPATARALCAYGLDSVDRIAAAPLATLQRILGAAAGRRVHERAHGTDPAPVTPNAPARAMAAEHRFAHDELDPGRRRRALLTLADGLGVRLRTSGQVARTLTLTVRYADRSTTTRSRTLPEPTAHTPALTAAAYALHAGLALERARVRSVALRAEGLMDAGLAAHQLTFDPEDDKAHRAEAAADRARARFGAGAVRPASFLDAA